MLLCYVSFETNHFIFRHMMCTLAAPHSSTGLKNTVLGFIDTLYPGSICSIYLFVIIIKLLILLLLFVEWCFRLFWIWIYLRCVKFIYDVPQPNIITYTQTHHSLFSKFILFFFITFYLLLHYWSSHSDSVSVQWLCLKSVIRAQWWFSFSDFWFVFKQCMIKPFSLR